VIVLSFLWTAACATVYSESEYDPRIGWHGKMILGNHVGGQAVDGELENQGRLSENLFLENLTGRHIAFVNLEIFWNMDFWPETALQELKTYDALPFFNFKPWPDWGVTHSAYSLTAIINGQQDAYLNQVADWIIQYQRPVLIAFACEMNGDWFPWSGVNNGAGTTNGFGDSTKADGPERYAAAYRHVVDVFRARGASNVIWVFQPDASTYPAASWNQVESYYPGDAYVDWIGVSVYGKQTPDDGDQTFRSKLDGIYTRLVNLSPTKPMMVAEWGRGEFSPANSKSLWITEALSDLASKRWPNIRAICYWDEAWTNEDNSVSDLRLNSSASARDAYKNGISNAEIFVDQWHPPPVALTAQSWPAGSGTAYNLHSLELTLGRTVEPSGASWHAGRNRLYVASDEGDVIEMDINGGVTNHWFAGGDLEGIAIANSSSNLIYLGVEGVNSIVEFNAATGTVTGKSWNLQSSMGSSASIGLEALAFVPNGEHPYDDSASGGLFYAGRQSNGTEALVYVFDVNLSVSGSVSLVDIFRPRRGTNDIAALEYDASTRKLYAVFDDSNLLAVMNTDGAVVEEYTLPGFAEEAFAIIPDCGLGQAVIFIGDDSTPKVWKYTGFPVHCHADLTRGPFLQLGGNDTATIIWQTDVSGNSVVEYGDSANLGFTATGSIGTTHVVPIIGLEAGQKYFYRIRSNQKILKVSPYDGLYEFMTHAASGSTGTFSFAVIGDFGDGSVREKAVKSRIQMTRPDFLITVGDNAYWSATAAEIQSKVFNIYKEVFHSAFFYPSLGNHDHESSDAQPSRDAYYLFANGRGAGAEELFYSFDFGDIHFVAFNSNKDYLSASIWADQKEWLNEDLAATESPGKLFIFIIRPIVLQRLHTPMTRTYAQKLSLFLKTIMWMLCFRGTIITMNSFIQYWAVSGMISAASSIMSTASAVPN